MAVTLQTPYNSSTAAPGSTVFSTDFRVILTGDLLVRINGATVTSGFTVSGLGSAGGVDVTFAVPMVGGESVELLRVVPLTRVIDYQQLGDFLSPVVNQDFDRLWMSQQEQEFKIGGAVRAPFPEQIPELPAASARQRTLLTFGPTGVPVLHSGTPGTVLGFNSSGDPVSVVPADGSAANLALLLAGTDAGEGAEMIGDQNGTTVQAALDTTRPLTTALPVIDATNVPASIAANPLVQRLLPAGAHTVPSYQPWNLYGPGELRFSGVDLPVPAAPHRHNLLRAGLNTVLASRAPSNVNFITLIGDSIGAGYHTANRSEHWFSLFMDYLRAGEVGASKTLDVVTLFNEPTRWDLTVAGTTTVGTEGPVQASLRMTPGATITYTGAFQFHEVFFQRAAGAGSLEFRFNGALYKTISCAGATASDVFTFPSTQSSGTSGTHEIRCVGANVTITGLWRAVQSTTLAEPYFLRAARPGWGTVSFTDADIDSVCRQAAPTGIDNGVFFIALGTNDMVNPSVAQSPANYAVNLDRIVQRILRNQPKAAIYFIPPTRLNFTAWPIVTAGANYYDYRAAAWEVCQSYGIPILDVDSLMLLERGLIPDGVHPNPTGHKLKAQFLAEQLSARPPAAIRKNSTRTGSILIDSAPSFTSGVGLIGAFNIGQGYLYAQNVETGAPQPLNIAHLGGALTLGNGATTNLAINVNSRTAASAGGFGAVPATVRAFIDVTVNGVDGCIPVFIRA